MLQVATFTFNPFSENTYILYDETKECIIIDPGMYTHKEEKTLVDFIETNSLKPVRLINTHCHIDHVFGNYFVAEKYGLSLETHKDEIPVLNYAIVAAQMYQLKYEPSPQPTVFWEEGDTISFGNTQLEVLFTPGHSPASICLFNAAARLVIAGDVLFRESVGRVDLPGGDGATLLKSIQTKLLPLGNDVIVYPGHMGSTTIGHEKTHNPYLNGTYTLQ